MNFIYKLKKITALFLILTLIILQSGCSFNESEKNNSTTTKNNVSESPLSSFDDFTNELFKEILCSNTLNLHSLLKDPASYGITDYEVTLGTYSEDSLDNTSFLIQCLNALNGFDKNKLSSSQQITYEQLKQYFENELEYSDLFLYGSSQQLEFKLRYQLFLLNIHFLVKKMCKII